MVRDERLQTFRLYALATLGAAAGMLQACSMPPESYVVWSPDGERSYVQAPADNGHITHLVVDGAGVLLAPPNKNDEIFLAWMPDSREIIAQRPTPARTWPQYARALGAARTAAAMRSARALADIIRDYQGDWHEFGLTPPSRWMIARWREQRAGLGPGVTPEVFYLERTDPRLIKPLVDVALADARREKSLDGPNAPVRFIHASDLNPTIDDLVLESPFAHAASDDVGVSSSTYECSWARPSPDGRAIAFICDESAAENRMWGGEKLYVTAAAPRSSPSLVATGVRSAAWSPDGRDLAYVRPVDSHAALHAYSNLGAVELATIAVSRVAATGGWLLDRPSSSGDLAVTNLGNADDIAWLPDGRILFASTPLPAATQQERTGTTFFTLRMKPGLPTFSSVLSNSTGNQVDMGGDVAGGARGDDPDGGAEPAAPSVDRLVASAALPDSIEAFVPSPDGKKVAILGRSGDVSVLFIQTGEVRVLQKSFDLEQYTNDSITIPSWKSADDLCYVIAAGEAGGDLSREELVVDSLGGSRRTISSAWSDLSFLPTLKLQAGSSVARARVH